MTALLSTKRLAVTAATPCWRCPPSAAWRWPRRRSPSRAGGTTTPISGTTQIIPAFEKQHPDIKVEVQRDRADRIQRRAQLAARRRHRRRPDHLPAVRQFARALQQGPSRAAERPPGHGELLRRRQERLDDRRRQDDLLRADGLGHPRLHLQQEDLRRTGAHAAEDPRRIPRRPRQDQGRRQLHAARHGHRRPVGSRPPWASRTSAPTTGRARTAARR